MELLSEYWVLKPSYQSVSVYDHDSNSNYIDYKKSGSSVVVVGTEEEILDLSVEFDYENHTRKVYLYAKKSRLAM